MGNGKLTAILLNLHKNRRSGILRVENKMEKKQLALEEGRLAFAESSLPAEHLAKIMADRKLIPVSKLREVTFAMKKGKISEDAILEIPGVKTQDIASGVAEQATVILASLWRWNDYAMNFYAGENLLSRKIKTGFSLPEAIISSARYAVAKHLYTAPHQFLEGRFETVGTLAAGAGEIPFNDGEAAVLINLQKPLNAIDLIKQAATQTGNPEEAILSLAALGLIRFQSPDEILKNVSDPDAMVLILENVLRRIETANHYEILSVPREVPTGVLHEAYHSMARQLHPDRFQSKDFAEDITLRAQKAFAAINEAYLVLKDPVTRKEYDEQLDEATQNPGGDNLSENEKMAETFFQAGRAFIAEREFGKAVEQFKKSVWLFPRNAKYNHYLGTAERGIPRLRRDAEKHLLAAIELDDSYVEARLELARLYMDGQFLGKAEQLLEQVLRLDPDNRHARRLLGRIT